MCGIENSIIICFYFLVRNPIIMFVREFHAYMFRGLSLPATLSENQALSKVEISAFFIASGT